MKKFTVEITWRNKETTAAGFDDGTNFQASGIWEWICKDEDEVLRNILALFEYNDRGDQFKKGDVFIWRIIEP